MYIYIYIHIYIYIFINRGLPLTFQYVVDSRF